MGRRPAAGVETRVSSMAVETLPHKQKIGEERILNGGKTMRKNEQPVCGLAIPLQSSTDRFIVLSTAIFFHNLLIIFLPLSHIEDSFSWSSHSSSMLNSFLSFCCWVVYRRLGLSFYVAADRQPNRRKTVDVQTRARRNPKAARD